MGNERLALHHLRNINEDFVDEFSRCHPRRLQVSSRYLYEIVFVTPHSHFLAKNELVIPDVTSYSSCTISVENI